MDEKRLQKRYAQSLFDLARQNGVLETICADVKSIYDVCKQNRELIVVLKNPVIKPLKKREILFALFEKHCDELTMKFLALIASKRREIYLSCICEEFLAIYNSYNNIKTATLTVAQPLNDKVKESIRRKLEADLVCKIDLREKVDEDIIGGFVIEADGKQYDASFMRKLNDLKRRITI